MTLREISKLEPGTKVYEIHNGEIRGYQILAFCQRDPNYFYLIDGSNHSKAVGHYLPTSNGVWESDYEQAKEIMWQQCIERLHSKNEIFFKNEKEIS